MSYVDANAELDRVPLEVLLDPTIELDLDFSAIGGVDLVDAAPGGDVTFCAVAAEARVAWVDSGLVALQFWFDSYVEATGVPAEVVADLDLLLEHAAQRIAWNFRRADEPILTDDSVAAAHRLVSAAVASCPELPVVIGVSDDALRKPWAEGSYNDLDPEQACANDRAEIEVAIVSYAERYDEPPRHLEQVEAALLAEGADFFFGSDLHVIESAPAGDVIIVPVDIGRCGSQ